MNNDKHYQLHAHSKWESLLKIFISIIIVAIVVLALFIQFNKDVTTKVVSLPTIPNGLLYLSAIPVSSNPEALTNIFSINLADNTVNPVGDQSVSSGSFVYSLTRSDNSFDTFLMIPTSRNIMDINQVAPHRITYNPATDTTTTEVLDVEIGLFSHDLEVTNDNSSLTFTTVMPDQFDIQRGDVTAWTVVVESFTNQFETKYLVGATNPIWLQDTVLGYIRSDGIYAYDVTTDQERLLVAAVDIANTPAQAVFTARDTLSIIHQADISYLAFAYTEEDKLFLANVSADGETRVLDSVDFATVDAATATFPFSLITLSPKIFASVNHSYTSLSPSTLNLYGIVDNQIRLLQSRALPEFKPGSVTLDYWEIF